MRTTVIVGIVALGLSISGCAGRLASVNAARSTYPVMLNRPTQPHEVLGHFRAMMQTNRIGGSAWEPDLANLIADEVNKLRGDAAVNVVMVNFHSHADGCLTVLTLGILNFNKSHIEGDVIRFK